MCCIAPPPLPHGSVQAAHTQRHMGLLNAGPQAGPQGPCAARVRHAHAQSHMRPLCRTLHAPERRPSPPADLLQVRGVGESPTACPRSRRSLAAPIHPLLSAPRTSRSATRCVQGMRCEISWIGMGRTLGCSNVCGARCAARHLRREQAHTSGLRSMRIRSGWTRFWRRTDTLKAPPVHRKEENMRSIEALSGTDSTCSGVRQI